jgi:hypoxanthine phosphoribosyltransferase
VTEENPRKFLEHSTVLATRQEVNAAIERMASEINAFYGDRPVILLVVMTGALIPAAWLADRLRMPLRIDFIHATRYDGATEGGEITFRVPPRLSLDGQDVLVVEDIYDVGLTLQSIVRYCDANGARSVHSAVLVRKLHNRETTGELPEFIGMEVEDRYIFGCGMDIHEHWRHLDEIRAWEEG